MFDFSILDKLILFKVIRNPIFFAECYLKDRSRNFNRLRIFYYQYPLLLLNQYICRAGRFIGKTMCIEIMIKWLTIAFRSTRVLLTSYRHIHVHNIMKDIKMDYLDKNNLYNIMFKKYMSGSKDSDYYAFMQGNSSVWGIAGGDDGKNYLGKRFEAIIEDEAQLCNFQANKEMLSTWAGEDKDTGDFIENKILPKHIANKIVENKGNLDCLTNKERQILVTLYRKAALNKNIVRRFLGVPNGIRSSPLWVYEKDNRYHNKVLNIPRYYYQYFTLKDYLEAVEEFGGEDSDLFKQQVLGEHGEPCQSVFLMEDIEKCIEYPKDLSNYFYKFVSFRYNSDLDRNQSLSNFIMLLNSIVLPKDYENIFVGIDCGSIHDPTIVSLFAKEKKKDVYRLFGIVKLTKIDWTKQVDYLEYIFNKYNVYVAGIDTGNAGIAIYEMLKERNLNTYVIPVSYKESITLGVKYLCNKCNIVLTQVKDNYYSCERCGFDDIYNAIKKEDKAFISEKSIDLLLERFANRGFILPNDNQIINEFQDYRSKVSSSGRRIYFGASDHIVDSFRTFVMSLLLFKEEIKEEEDNRPQFIFGESQWEQIQRRLGNIDDFGNFVGNLKEI